MIQGFKLAQQSCSHTFAEVPKPEVHSPIPRAAFHAHGRFVGVGERSQPSPDQRGALAGWFWGVLHHSTYRNNKESMSRSRTRILYIVYII